MKNLTINKKTLALALLIPLMIFTSCSNTEKEENKDNKN